METNDKRIDLPVFIIGVGRSGTSLLQSMLHAHSKFIFLPETQFLRKYVLRHSPYQKLNNTDKETLREKLKKDEQFSRTKIRPESIIENSKTLIDCYWNLLSGSKQKETRYFGDKDPRLIDYLSELNIIFPSSKIVHIIRDPRDVILSRTKADWSKNRPFFMQIFMYRTQLERGRRAGKKLFKSNYYELYYEDLIENPVETLEGLCKFFDVPFEKKMLEFGNAAKDLVDAKEMQWKKETLGPLLNNNKDKWKTKLTNDQVYLIQEICSRSFISHPYEKIDVTPGFKVILSRIILSFLARIFDTVYPFRKIM